MLNRESESNLTVDVDDVADAGADVRQWIWSGQSPYLTQRLQRVLLVTMVHYIVMKITITKEDIMITISKDGSTCVICDLHVNSMILTTNDWSQFLVWNSALQCHQTLSPTTATNLLLLHTSVVVGSAVVDTRLLLLLLLSSYLPTPALLNTCSAQQTPNTDDDDVGTWSRLIQDIFMSFI